ncbi:MAG TPA: hypothetical protein VMV98_03840, partial [Acidobacteriaceae bacterium]|nr:hypothetical protein [Acidobacteriaceae bacterium]
MANLHAAIRSKLQLFADLLEFTFTELAGGLFRFQQDLGNFSPLAARSISQKHSATEVRGGIVQNRFEVEIGLNARE